MVNRAYLLAIPTYLLFVSQGMAANTAGMLEITCSQHNKNGQPGFSFSWPIEFKNGSAVFSRGGKNARGEKRSEQWTVDARKLNAVSIRSNGSNARGQYTVAMSGHTQPSATDVSLSGSMLNRRGAVIRRCTASVALGGQTFAALTAPAQNSASSINVNIQVVNQIAVVAEAEAEKYKAEKARLDAEAERELLRKQIEAAAAKAVGSTDASRETALNDMKAREAQLNQKVDALTKQLVEATQRAKKEKELAEALNGSRSISSNGDAKAGSEPTIKTVSPAQQPKVQENPSADEIQKANAARKEADERRARAEAELERARREAQEAALKAAQKLAEAEASLAKGQTQQALPAPTPAIKQQAQSAEAKNTPRGNADPGSEIITEQNAKTLNKQIGSLSAQLNVLMIVRNEQKSIQDASPITSRDGVTATIAAIESRMELIKTDLSRRERIFRRYLTNIRPDDRDLYLTARKASEVYPRIPYYIPGTSETGEFWVEPVVSERGEMMFNFQFVDLDAYVSNVRGKIEMTLPELEDAQKALFKLWQWSSVAHREKIRHNYEKRITCFPAQDCPEDGERKDGVSSTEVRFNVYEDGSTAGRIQRNKGRFAEGYNVSIESGLLLQAYLAHVIKEARLEFRSGTQDKKSLDKLFQ